MTVNSAAWVTGSVYLPHSRRIAIASSDGAISFCGIVRGSYDLMRKVYTNGKLGMPQCLCLVEAEDEEYVVCGDDNGFVSLLLSEPDDISSNRFSSHQFEILHSHRDWVTQVDAKASLRYFFLSV